MTDFSELLLPERGQNARTLHLVDAQSFPQWRETLSPHGRQSVEAAQFEGKAGQKLVIAAKDPEHWQFALGVANAAAPTTWDLAPAAESLPGGRYRLAEGQLAGPAVFGWLMAQHHMDHYRHKQQVRPQRTLLVDEACDMAEWIALAQATALVRDLVNRPAADLGPAELATEVEAQGKAFGAQVRSIVGEDLLSHNFPMIHAVGRAAAPHRAPRLIELSWGHPDHPLICLVGKGVCFDSGGLDIKPSSAMAHMKKDMGGAAHALALARLIMQAGLPVRLRLLIAAVENAISGDAMRPGDILSSRKGLHIEITNTDAEGRLVLGDALTLATEDAPELLLDFATLTGAARVALGPQLPALFSNDDALAAEIRLASEHALDPLWQLPLWDGYDDMLKSHIADLVNASEGGFAGAITAALFLRHFVPKETSWAHVDLFAWTPTAKPGRPKGGEAMTLRAFNLMLKNRYKNTT